MRGEGDSTETAASEMTPPAVSGTLVRLSGTARFFAVTIDYTPRVSPRVARARRGPPSHSTLRERAFRIPPRTLAPRRRTGARLRLRRSRSRRESVGAPPPGAERRAFRAGSAPVRGAAPVRPAGLRPGPPPRLAPIARRRHGDPTRVRRAPRAGARVARAPTSRPAPLSLSSSRTPPATRAPRFRRDARGRGRRRSGDARGTAPIERATPRCRRRLRASEPQRRFLATSS